MQKKELLQLIAALDIIQQSSQRVDLPDALEETEFIPVVEAINGMLDRLAVRMKVSEQAADSLATASVRMVLLSDVQERLNSSDKRVKTPDDLNQFIQEILTDLTETLGASMSIYLSRAPGTNNNAILVHQVDDSQLTNLKQSTSFREFIKRVSLEKKIVNQEACGQNVDCCAMLAAPLWLHQRLAGIMILIGKRDKTNFNRDDESVLDHLLPNILRVLERIDFLFELEHSNRLLREEQIRQRALTEEINQTMKFLEAANNNLKQNFIISVHVFANFIEMRSDKLAGHSRRVADTARTLARRLGMDEAGVQDVFLAGLLHDIGKLSLSDYLFEKPFSTLNDKERLEVIKHPVKGEIALLGIEQLQVARQYIHAHHERFDGLGYPDNKSGLMIPLGARILAVANDFDSVQIGTRMNKHFSRTEALAYIYEGRGNRYDPAIVDVFLGVVNKSSVTTEEIVPEVLLQSIQLSVGMVLSRDLLDSEGNMILSKDYILTEPIIHQIKNFERTENFKFSIWIRVTKKG